MPLIESIGSGSTRGFGQFGKTQQTFTNVVEFSHTGGPQYFNVPSGISELKVKMWGGAGGEYNGNVNLSNGGGCGGYTETTFNVIEQQLTIVVGGGITGNNGGAYGGGGGAINGGTGGGGASLIISGNISTPFENYVVLQNANRPTSSLTSLAGASGIIAVAGGGGGAGWYIYEGMYGGGGGGLIGGNSSGGYTTAFGGTQSASTNGSQSNFAARLTGGSITQNFSSGGSGGGGGGWYGGGASQGASGVNTSGGGGSSFIGYINGSTSSTLSPNQANSRDYIDTITRTNGSRYYKDSKVLSSAAGVFTPPNNSDIHYSSGIAVPTYYPGNDGTSATSGHGKVVLIY
jgi:hypothetical protein